MAVRPKDMRPHVIVVEDEQFQRETLVDFLDENGYRTSGVDSGAALRKLVEKDPPALVLLDLRLPGGEDGFTLARFLRERSRKMGIIMVTASGDTVDQVVGLETGADDYIAKPYESRALLARMKAVLRRAGGAEAAVTYVGIVGFNAMRALSTRNDDPQRASRPFDKDRDGFVLGEGAGVLVLEEYEHAKARGAKIYAELGGFGMSADAGHMTAPNMDGPRRAMVGALRNAGVNADQVNYLNAHGTSTPLGDINETNAIKLALGDHAKQVVVNSTKSMTGHLLGGAGGIESVFTVLAVHHQVSPPTINIFNQDPECDLDYCANTARDLKIDVAVKNNFGFGGTNGTLVFKRLS